MTEHNIFCYAKKYNDEDSFQQKRYRAFNKEVGKERYTELNELIKNDILKDFKLELNKNSWVDEWKKLSNEQLKRLQEIPEFDCEVFADITGLDPSKKEEDDKTQEAIRLLKENGYKISKKQYAKRNRGKIRRHR